VLEPRTAARGYIATTEDSINVYGAGTTKANGLYVRNGNSVDTNPLYTLYKDDVAVYQITSTAGSLWAIQDVVSTDILYSNVGGATVPEGVWTVEAGGVPLAPVVQALSEIGEAMGYWSGAKWAGGDPTSLTAYPDQNGIRVASNVTGTVYVAYKKSWTDTFGNGESGTLATVPTEWAEFMAYDAARSYRASQGGEDGFNPIALRDVNNALERALMTVSRSGAIAALTNQLKTQYSVDDSV
jgi:hypothetical protein